MAWAGVEFGFAPNGSSTSDVSPGLFGRTVLGLDHLSAPLLPLVALLHFLTALATARTQMTRFSFSWLLVGESIRLATLSCTSAWGLGVLVALTAVLPYIELVRRGRPTRVYVLHMGLFVVFIFAGLAAGGAIWGPVLLTGAILVRSGVFPLHAWVSDLFENCSFGSALMFVTPITGLYLALRLVLPVAPDWVMQVIGVAALVTTEYAAGLAVMQTEARRFFAYLFLSYSSLILVGMELHTAISLTAALSLWVSAALSLTGLGLTLRAVEARFGRLTMTEFRGLYESSPSLAMCFMLTGLASVGFPGTLGFVAAELLVDVAVRVNPVVGVALVVAAGLNGIAIVRAYFLIFTGGRYVSAVPLGITYRERIAVLTLSAFIIGGGLAPQRGLESSHKAAEMLVDVRAHEAESIVQP